MFKAERFNNLLKEIHKKEEEKKKAEQQKQQEIQLQMKLVEDSLNDMENKFKQALEKGTEYPKFATINQILCDEVKKELIMNQEYLIDESYDITRLFYNKELFDKFRKEGGQVEAPNVKNKAYEELAKSCLKAPNIEDEEDERLIKLLEDTFGCKNFKVYRR